MFLTGLQKCTPKLTPHHPEIYVHKSIIIFDTNTMWVDILQMDQWFKDNYGRHFGFS